MVDGRPGDGSLSLSLLFCIPARVLGPVCRGRAGPQDRRELPMVPAISPSGRSGGIPSFPPRPLRPAVRRLSDLTVTRDIMRSHDVLDVGEMGK